MGPCARLEVGFPRGVVKALKTGWPVQLQMTGTCSAMMMKSVSSTFESDCVGLSKLALRLTAACIPGLFPRLWRVICAE